MIRPWRAPDLANAVLSAGLGSMVRREDADGRSLDDPSLDAVPQGTSAELLQASYDEGYGQGYSEGNVAANDAAMKRVETLIAGLEEAQRTDQAALEEEVLDLARAMARLILRRELIHEPDSLVDIVRRAMARLPANSHRPDVHLNPADAAVVRPLMAEENAARIIDDDTIERGGCRVQSRSSRIEAGIDQLVESIALQCEVPDS